MLKKYIKINVHSISLNSGVVVKTFKGRRLKFELESLIIEYNKYWLCYITLVLIGYNTIYNLLNINDPIECIMQVN